jgi:hypothetical protein
MITPEATSVVYDPAIEPLVRAAIEDLAQRLGTPSNQIVVTEASRVVWPNSSLGCPQPGMVYAEVITPGFLIILMVGGEDYEYHTSTVTEVLYCEYPTPPIPGTPADT